MNKTKQEQDTLLTSSTAHLPIILCQVPGEMKANCLLRSLTGNLLEVLVQEYPKIVFTLMYIRYAVLCAFLRKGNLLNLFLLVYSYMVFIYVVW